MAGANYVRNIPQVIWPDAGSKLHKSQTPVHKIDLMLLHTVIDWQQ